VASEILGVLRCPHCGSDDATIHRHAKNTRLYYRCYQEKGSNIMRCGTVQIIGPSGQQYLQRILDNGPAIAKPAPENVPKVAIAKPVEQPPSVKQSFLDRFLAGDDE